MKINKEIQRYQESILFGLSLRQMVFALLAIGVAVGAYFGLKPLIGAAEGGHPLGNPLSANVCISSAESICRIAAGFQFHAGGADA